MPDRKTFSSVLWNLFGTLAPVLVAVVTMPKLISNLGNEKFGLLTIAWMMVGYFSLFDLGLSRSLTRYAAERLVLKEFERLGAVANKIVGLSVLLGSVAGLVLYVLSENIVVSALNVSESFRGDAGNTFRVLSASIPFVILSAVLIGLLEAYGAFSVVNKIRVVMGVSNFLGPLFCLQVSQDLSIAVGSIFVVRVLGMAVYWVGVEKICRLGLRASFDFSGVKEILAFGGWASVSNLISPIMVNFDRFFIGAFLSLSVVSFYTTPFEMVSRVSLISMSMMGVFFPIFTKAYLEGESDVVRSYNTAFLYVVFSTIPVVSLVAICAFDLLQLWINEEFAKESHLVLSVLCVGVLFNSAGRVPFGLIQATGRSDLTAKVNLLEVIPYLGILFLCLNQYGILGAAFAWAFRLFVDYVLMTFVAERLVCGLKDEIRFHFMILSAVLAFSAFAYVVNPFWLKVLLLFIGFALLAFWYISRTGGVMRIFRR